MKTCVYCGEEFTGGRADRKYCRELCARRAYQKRRLADGRYTAYREANSEKLAEYREKNHGRWHVQRTCVMCGTVWGTHRKDAKYCSQECYAKAQRARPRKAPKPKPAYVRPLGLRELFEQERYDEAMRSLMARTVMLDTGCRVMRGKPTAQYPTVFWTKTSKRAAHRLVLWAKTKGSIDGWHAHHTCSNPSCVEPDHLVPATAAENVGEMLARRTYEAEIDALREALAEFCPGHALLQRSLPSVAA